MDDWDSVSSENPKDSVNNAWDTASAPQPPTRRRRVVPDNLMSDNSTASQQEAPVTRPSAPYQDTSSTSPTKQTFTSAPWLKKAVPFVLIALVLVISGVGLFWEYASIHVSDDANATATAAAEATVNAAYTNATATAETEVTTANVTATAQAVATATALQQVYTQATSGTPAVDDPLSGDNGNLLVFDDGNGNVCAFRGGVYHVMASPTLRVQCVSNRAGSLDNFALQVQVSIVEGGEGGVFFGNTSDSNYKAFITSGGAYFLYLYNYGDKRYQTLLSGSSPAIKTGLNQANVVTVIVDYKNFYLYVNNQYVNSNVLSNYSQGQIGLVADNSGKTGDVAFSNMKVWTL